jgi:hypothetical protein
MRLVPPVAPDSLARLAGAELSTLEKVVRWVAPLGGDIVDIVVQDEFTHDVVVAVAGLWLVYDTT